MSNKVTEFRKCLKCDKKFPKRAFYFICPKCKEWAKKHPDGPGLDSHDSLGWNHGTRQVNSWRRRSE